MKEIIIGVARFIPGFFETLIHLSFKPYATVCRVVRTSDLTNACLYFFLCVLLTQLFRFRMFSDFDQIIKIGAVDIGWKIIAGLLVIIYLWAITAISKEPDLTRLTIFVAFIFGTFSIIVQSALILGAGVIFTGNDTFGECASQIASYTAPRMIDTEKCKELAAKYPFLYPIFTEWVVGAIVSMLVLIPIGLLWLLWVYKILRAYIDNFLIGKRRWLGTLVLIISFPALMYVIINIRSSFLEHTMKI